MCFYDQASQSEGYARTNKVSLGTWKGFSNDYQLAEFENGDSCGEVGWLQRGVASRGVAYTVRGRSSCLGRALAPADAAGEH